MRVVKLTGSVRIETFQGPSLAGCSWWFRQPLPSDLGAGLGWNLDWLSQLERPGENTGSGHVQVQLTLHAPLPSTALPMICAHTCKAQPAAPQASLTAESTPHSPLHPLLRQSLGSLASCILGSPRLVPHLSKGINSTERFPHSVLLFP